MSRDLLPWYANGTLEVAERLAVENVLVASAEARAELALWRAVAADAVHVADEPSAGGVDLGWLRLQRQLNAAPARAPLRRWQLAAAAALVAIVGAESLLLVRQQRTHDAELRQLAAEPAGVRADEWRVQVRFRPEATMATIDALLRDLDARVVGGPSALGIYDLAVPRGARFADAQAVAQWLGTQPGVEQSVAPP